MITTLYLIRHGKTIGGEEKRYKGHMDVPLSDEGTVQIEEIARHIRGRIDGNSRWVRMVNGSDAGKGDPDPGMDAVYCSDLVRAEKSAEIIATGFGLKPVPVAQFRERSFGRWEGMSFDEIKDAYPEEFGAWAGDPLRFSPVGGESTIEVRERVMPVFHEIVRKHFNQRIAIVAHGGVNRIILCELLNIPLQNIFRVEQNFGCLNVIEFYDEVPVLKLMNFTG